MTKIYLLSAFCMVVIILTLGQYANAQPNRQDAVYLRNGSIIRGKILENVTGENTRIETIGRNVLVIPEGDIERIVMDEPIPVKERTDVKPYGYLALADIGFLGGEDNSISLLLTNCWKFKNRISIGAGFGIEKFEYQVMPLYADIRYNFLKGRITPLIFVQGGYSFPLGNNSDQNTYQETNYTGGAMFNPGIGLRLNFNNRNALVFSLGWRYQELCTKWKYNYWYQDEQSYERTDFYRRIAIRAGFIFN
jgi:hypothetical protein